MKSSFATTALGMLVSMLLLLATSDVQGLFHHQLRKLSPLASTPQEARLVEERVKAHLKKADPGGLQPKVMAYDQRVNHFNASDDSTFKMQYLINDAHWDETRGPILFYAGNEGGVWGFYNNSGFIVETLAKEFGALVVFAEHRFYGNSMPFGNKSFEKENLSLLSVEQVLWDYIDLLGYIKASGQYKNLEDRATIAFGGSYGGMLAAWLRMKYPQWIQGALASSAPVRWFKGATDPSAFTETASAVIRKLGGDACYQGQQRGFFELVNVQHDPSKWAKLKEIFNLCDDLTSPEQVETLISSLSDSIGTMAMVNYPYPTSFIGSLPAWPLKAACDAAAKVEPVPPGNSTQSIFSWANIRRLQAAANVAYNFTGDMKCLSLSSDDGGALDDNGWEVQTCNEFPMPMGDDPAVSCFTWKNWDQAAFTRECRETYGMTPRYDWALDYFGGRDPAKDFAASSNIFFSNGQYDPWHAGGILTNSTANNIAFVMDEAAHHLDLRSPNAADPPAVVTARLMETTFIRKVVEAYQNPPSGQKQ